jgi:hypothetical protein
MGTVRYKIAEQNGQELVKEIHKVIVHRFQVGDVEDPDLYAAEPLWNWQESEQGKFVMEHAIDKPEWHRHIDHQTYGHQYIVVAELEAKKLSEFYLKWGKDGSKSNW